MKRHEILGWVAVAMALVTLLAACSHIFVALAGLDSGQNQAVAAWVQAIGSIGAIVGAVWLAHLQSRAMRREKQAAIFAVVHAAVEEARKFRAHLTASDPEEELYLNYHESIVESYVSALSNCPVHELHSPVAVTAHLMLRDQFPFLRKSIEICIAGPSEHPQMKVEFNQFDGVLLSKENQEQLDARMERQRKVLRRNVEIHIDAIETRYREMAFALGDVANLVE